HERGSSYVADMRECHVLPPRVSDLLLPLRELVGALSLRERLPQIEVAIGGAADGLLVALVLRVLEPPSDGDRQRLLHFAARERVELWLQPGGPDSVSLLCTCDGHAATSDGESQLAYRLPGFGVTMPFRPTDFTQVNHRINEVLVSRAVRLLDPQPGERVADLFCGLGNFSLPLARRAREVVGIEGSATLARRARDNAVLN